MTQRRPNILVIMSDEHNASVTGCYGNGIVRTPHLDALAARGVTFDACYTASPLCVPARLAFTSGKYISRNGAWSNNCWLPSDDVASLPRVLNAAGYDTVLCGKMHYDRERRYGFSMDLGIGNNSRKTGTGNRRAVADLEPRPGVSQRFQDFRLGGEDENGCMRHDLQVTEKGSAFLRERGRGQKPFFMLAGYLSPHFPLIVPEKWWRPYEDRVPMPVIPPGHLDRLPLNYRHLRVGFHNEDVPAQTVQLGRELYYGFTEWFDDQVGKLLGALTESGLAEDTVVVYTTDHGENLGEHGLWWKNAMYEHAARIPLVVSWPARWAGGQRRREACSLLDLVQTIAELAGQACPEDWDGDSLCPWLDNPAAPWKDRALSQYYAHNIASGFVMLRQGHFKYVYHSPPDPDHAAEEELYDLRSGPGEFTNLASRPEHRPRCQTMLATVVRELGEHPDEIETRCRADYAKGYGRAPAKGRAAAAGANAQLMNARFIDGDLHWDHRGTPGRFRVEATAGAEGGPALVFRKPEDDPAPVDENSHLDQSVRVQPHTRYRLGMRVKASADLRPVLRAADGNFGSVVEVLAGDSRDWQVAQQEFDTGELTAVRLQFFGGARGRIRETAPGTSWLDQVILEPVGNAED
ncbi:MAG: sulfatase-like hydrolase/transferase [Lentisphaeria bacterium]|nr:sulfatase-like hydrolase/transferase [Lentisphaeria bacterium]